MSFGNIFSYVSLEQDVYARMLQSLVILGTLWLVKFLICSMIRKRVKDPARYYHWRRMTVYIYSLLAFIVIGRIWIRGIDSLATFLGLLSAGLALALHNTIANLAGWVFIMSLKPFKVGDRIQVGDMSGDVIDIGLMQFSMIEIGNWVAADQSTGRIVHVPNSKAFQEPLANYEIGFEYIWHEIPVLVTFESNWEKAKGILMDIAKEKAAFLAQGAEDQIRRAAMKYLIYFTRLTPTVYTTVRDSGILLTMRYIVKPRQRRNSEQEIWEAILRAFAMHDDISLAYPTTRFYASNQEKRIEKGSN